MCWHIAPPPSVIQCKYFYNPTTGYPRKLQNSLEIKSKTNGKKV